MRREGERERERCLGVWEFEEQGGLLEDGGEDGICVFFGET